VKPPSDNSTEPAGQPEQEQALPWEWRPAIVQPSEKKQHYTVDWCFKTFEATSSGGPKRQPEEHESKTVMLTPRVPKMAESFDPAHEAILDQAKTLRTLGKTDWEIEATLNASLKDSWNAKKQTAGEKSKIDRPPRITVDIIRTYLYRAETLEAQTNAAAAGLKTGRLTNNAASA